MRENSSIEHTKNILVVGSWAKEQITIENIQKNKKYKVFCYMDTENPAIKSFVDGYKIGSLKDVEKIVDYSKEKKIDLVLITTASPLSHGLVDLLEKENITVFGPDKNSARLESDKSYARFLMKKHGISELPDFETFSSRDDAIKYCKNKNWNVAVKPIGLTEGLGVKVYGDQLKTKDDVIDYINEIFEKRIGGDSKVLIEEKITGDEFTIQCLVYDTNIISTPAVQDFKKLLPGDRGPNTASMGSYSDSKLLLPFMDQQDYITAIDVIMKTLQAYKKETGKSCKGFLYGQFMKTKKGLKLIEYNFRPGDPEWLNTVSVMKENLVEIILNLMKGNQKNIDFEEKATVVKYIVPKGYPEELNKELKVNFDAKKINNLGVNIYYSCGFDKDKKLRVGSERGIAFVSKAETIKKANDNVEKAISIVDGSFHYRDDIADEKTVKT